MTQYLMGLFALAVCCAAVELLAPAGEGGGIGRHIKLMSALCLLCVLIAPMTSLVQNGEDIRQGLEHWISQWADEEQATENFTQQWQEQLEQMDTAYAGELVAQMLQSKFGLAVSDVRVTLTIDQTGKNIEEMRVALTGRAIWADTHAMDAYIRDSFGCKSTIYIE